MQTGERSLRWENGFGRGVAEFHMTGRETSAIGFSLTGPQHGWLFFTLDLGDGGRFMCRVSSIPNDFLGELAKALVEFLSGKSEVSIPMHGEPDTFVLYLGATQDGNTRFELRYKESFDSLREDPVWGITTVGTSICANLFELVQGYCRSLAESEYSADMGWEFPSAHLSRLQTLCAKQ